MTHELKTTATLILRFSDENEMRQYVQRKTGNKPVDVHMACLYLSEWTDKAHTGQRKTDCKPVDVHMACLYLSEWTDQAHTGYFFYPCGDHEIEVKFRPGLPYKFLLE